MFGKLFNFKKDKSVEFNTIKAYVNKDKYFVRTKSWDWLNEKQIYVANVLNNKPTMITMEPWPQEIFLDADGQITVSEMVELASKMYLDSNMPIPPNLDQIIIDELESLVFELSIIELKDTPTTLPPNLLNPMSENIT